MIELDVWLYGPLARFAGEKSEGSFAHLPIEVPEGTTMGDLLSRMGVPPGEKGITFVNAELTDMPDLAADVDLELRDGDRVGLFHLQSMWPFQYRHGAAVAAELREAMRSRLGGGLRHSSASIPRGPAEEGR